MEGLPDSKSGSELLSDGFDILIPDDFAVNLDELLPDCEVGAPFEGALGGYGSIFPEMFIS